MHTSFNNAISQHSSGRCRRSRRGSHSLLVIVLVQHSLITIGLFYGVDRRLRRLLIYGRLRNEVIMMTRRRFRLFGDFDSFLLTT